MGAQFKLSLVELIERMTACKCVLAAARMQCSLICSPHFVRCIKPNLDKTPANFVDDFVLAQLRYTGCLQFDCFQPS